MSLNIRKGLSLSIGELFLYIQSNIPHLSKAASIDLLSFLVNVERKSVLAKLKEPILIDERAINSIELVKKGYPVSYLRKNHEFFGYEFYVDENVLIPRVETEVLVEEVLKNVHKDKEYKILDICTGSGCILISLLKNLPNSFGVGIDIDFKALKIARLNIEKHSLENRGFLVNTDAFYIDKCFNTWFDIITMNPPYVSRNSNYSSFIKYEPEIALFTGDDDLIFYKKMLFILDKLCKRDGLIFFEIGFDQSERLKLVYKDKNVRFVEDYFGNKRVMVWKN
jgi:release factor glutamine methyltransferase